MKLRGERTRSSSSAGACTGTISTIGYKRNVSCEVGSDLDEALQAQLSHPLSPIFADGVGFDTASTWSRQWPSGMTSRLQPSVSWLIASAIVVPIRRVERRRVDHRPIRIVH